MREGAGGRGHRRGPSSVPPCLPDPAPAIPAGRGTPGGAAPHRNRPSLLYTRQGRSARGRSPGALPACLPALPPASPPGGGRRAAPLSHRRCRRRRRLRNRRAPRASHSSPQPGATRPPHWLSVTCRGGLRQSAPPERACRIVWKLSLLSPPPGSGSSRSSATGHGPRPRPPARDDPSSAHAHAQPWHKSATRNASTGVR